MRRVFIPLLLCVVVLLLPAPAVAAKRKVPRGWLGTVATQELIGTRSDRLGAETARMARSGVESVRAPFYWAQAQPDAPAADTSPTYTWAETDPIVLSAARAGLTVMPTVLGAPRWAAVDPFGNMPRPRDPRQFAAYVTAAIERYGPKGTLWSENPGVPKRPIRSWQVWNEPNHKAFWGGSYADYVDLLRAVTPAIRRADRGADVVLGGLINESWRALAKLYDRKARGLFDVVAVHPYTFEVRNVGVVVERSRRVMRRNGDAGKRIVLTEMSWPAAQGRTSTNFGFNETETGMARKLRAAVLMLAKRRKAMRISGVYWYNWVSEYEGDYPFAYSGLLRPDGDGSLRTTPAFAAFTRVGRALQGRR